MSILVQKRLGIRPVQEYSPLENGFWNAAVPSRCILPLQQHAGGLLKPLVKTGDIVREGMVVAEGEGRLTVPLHAPIPGRVVDTGNVRLFDGTTCTGLAIELDGEFDRLGKQLEPRPWESIEREELLQLIRAAGVVCGPRSAVPAHVYLGGKRQLDAPVVVLDLAENEPYMTAGLELAAGALSEVFTGLQIAARAAASEDVHVVMSPRARRRLAGVRKMARQFGFNRHLVSHHYPAITEATVPAAVSRRKRRELSDFLVISPDTAYAIHDAVVYGKPQIDGVVAVGGSAVARPAHVRVRFGTSIGDVLAECGGLTDDPERIIVGGPFTGQRILNVNAPVTKNIAAVVAMNADEVRDGRTEPCVGCGACTRACPVHLDPRFLHRLIAGGRLEDARAAGLDTCIECGLCSTVCPSRIPLTAEFRRRKSSHPLRNRDDKTSQGDGREESA